MIACPRCGQESPQGSLHCVHCGFRLSGEDDPARTVIGMPALKPLGNAGADRKPGSLLAGLPALRTKTSSPLVSGEFSLKGPEGADSTPKSGVGLPIFEGTKKTLEPEPVDAEAPTMGMEGLTDAQLAAAETATVAMAGLTDEQLAEPAPTMAMSGLTDAQLEQGVPAAVVAPAAAVEAPPRTEKAVPAVRPRKDDPAHHPQRKEATQAKKPGDKAGGGLKWVIIALVVAGGAYAAWYFLR